ncbi:MAG: single-stranded-DNA-specific exonuclease RecJ [Alphaproteobacteria bacterium]|nr:single-stranded-DNA-specific exonuclease RecJ [Alphaproteobacteria bacterium]
MSETPAFLGVDQSAGGNRWEMSAADERAGLAIAQRHSLPEMIGRLLAARGVGIDEVELFLNPSLRDQLPDPRHLRDMDEATARLMGAIRDGETIGIFGDYDVDGATSTALLKRFFQAVGGTVETYIPDRQREGYGPNLPALMALRDKGARVVCTVDCGITAFEPLDGAAAAGIDVIVVDHHVAEPRLPAACAVVNPNRLDDDSPHGQLAAVGVAFLLVVAVNRALRESGWYETRPEPDLRAWLDLVALGTVCDVVPLTGVNRALVTQGLKVMTQRSNKGIVALADVARIKETPEAYHAGFLLGPRVNAGGRVGESWLGADLLSTEDAAQAHAYAERLDSYNTERRAIEATCLEAAMAEVEARIASGADDASLVYVSAEDWHPGVIGIVAGRLKDRFNRPACVVAMADGVGKGSGRSVRGVDLGAAIIAARQSGLLINGGGHKMAAGFTVAADQEAAFRDFLSARIAEQSGPGGLTPRMMLDGALMPAAATLDLVHTIERLAPFGAGNPRPRFALPAARVARADVVGENHVRCFLTGEGGGHLKAIAFRVLGEPLGDALLKSGGLPLHIAGTLRIDRWQGREDVQFMIDDAAPIA